MSKSEKIEEKVKEIVNLIDQPDDIEEMVIWLDAYLFAVHGIKAINVLKDQVASLDPVGSSD